MREYTTRSDDCTNTIITVQKDNYILCIGAAMRGKYCNKKNTTKKRIKEQFNIQKEAIIKTNDEKRKDI